MSGIFINTFETKRFNACNCYISKNKQSDSYVHNEIKKDIIHIKTEITEDDVRDMFNILKNTEDVKTIITAYYNKNIVEDNCFAKKQREKILNYVNLIENALHFRDKMLNKVRNFKKIKFTDKLVNQLSYSRGNDIYNYQRSAFFVFDNKFYKKISESFKKFDTSLKNTSTGCNERWFNGIKYDLNKQITKLLDKNNGNFTVCK